jgi:hypothetical protein
LSSKNKINQLKYQFNGTGLKNNRIRVVQPKLYVREIKPLHKNRLHFCDKYQKEFNRKVAYSPGSDLDQLKITYYGDYVETKKDN